MSAERLDRFYVKANNRGRFLGVSISPNFLSDHHYISMTVSIPCIKSFFTYWHFNNNLLQDNNFIHAFHSFWKAWKERKRDSFSSLSRW